jgi:hypothetical protein
VKLTRAQVHTRVLASAALHSALMLEHENACFARVAGRFAAPPKVPFRTVKGFRDNADARARMVDDYATRLYLALSDVEQLAGFAGSRARTAILRELRLCEQGLPVVHRGKAAVAVDGVDVAAVQAEKLWVWKETVAGYPAYFRSSLTDLLSRSAEVEQLQRGLFGPRGSWWARISSLQQHARGMATAVGNEVRLKAMERFNA